MNYCPNCGSELRFKEAEICPKCGVRIKKPQNEIQQDKKEEISTNTLIISYIASLLFPILGIPLSLYCLIKGKVIHFIGIGVVTVFSFFFWVGLYSTF